MSRNKNGAKTSKQVDKPARLIRSTLRREFPRADAYRYNIASLRVRVIDDRFRGKNRIEREKMVLPLLNELPQSVQDDIIFLALLTPDETPQSELNAEFEHPERLLFDSR